MIGVSTRNLVISTLMSLMIGGSNPVAPLGERVAFWFDRTRRAEITRVHFQNQSFSGFTSNLHFLTIP